MSEGTGACGWNRVQYRTCFTQWRSRQDLNRSERNSSTMSCSRRFFLIFAQKTCERMERSSVKESNWKVNVFMPKSPLFPCHDVSWGKSAACLVSSRRRAHREQGLEWKFPETLSDLFDQKDKKLKLLIVVVKDHAKDIGHTAVNQSSQNWESSIWAPFAWKVTLADFQNVSARRFGSWHSKSYHC